MGGRKVVEKGIEMDAR